MKDIFLTNTTEITFLDKIKKSLKICKKFSFTVSFIKIRGLILLSKEIDEALQRGVEGKIITSTYQNFTDIASLRLFKKWMDKYPNFECHLDYNCFENKGFHTKGYLFEYDDSNEFIVGSSNITSFALINNVEWNVSLSSEEEMKSTKEAYKAFDDLFNKTLFLDDDLINKYSMQLEYAIEKWDMDYFDPVTETIQPNAMQRKALKELRRFRDLGVNKALVVAATGSGKTYLAAFDARNYGAEKVLFVCHKDKILSDARNSFAKVFGTRKTCGLFVGNNKEVECDFIFASNIMLARHLEEFNKDQFDYIIMDECHHAAAGTYKKIMEYFKPGFILGITATPERMDNEDIFELFDKNVPYELRLRDAIINDLVVPFHYYGIRDKLVDYKSKDENVIRKEISKTDNIDFIKKEIEKHKQSGKLKAIAFCTCLKHLNQMAEAFKEVGYNAISLSGESDLGQRTKAFKDLQDENNPLEIICAVDILNEGIDIPGVNMVLFLRPTESSTIFIQQLGRGLRKAEGKQYATVLDFIGNNYERSVQIAMALGTLGQSSIIEKKYLADLVKNDFQRLDIPGVVIDIDELSKEEIINYINNTNFNLKDYLRKDYQNFKKYLKCETYPSHMDFFNCEFSPDIIRFMKSKLFGKKNRSYYQFLNKIGEESLPEFKNNEIEFIDSISDLLPIVRPDEFIIIKQLLNGEELDLNKLVGYNSKVTIITLEHALKHLKDINIVNSNGSLVLNISNKILMDYLVDLIEYGITRCDSEFGDYEDTFKLYANYSKEQIQEILLQKVATYMRGTEFIGDKTYCFVNLKKDVSKEERLNYKDKFLSNKKFQWESVKNTTFSKGDGPKLLKTKEVYLFVRKMDEEDGINLPFTYFGKGKFTNPRPDHTEEFNEEEEKTIEYPTLVFDIELENEVEERFSFDYEIPTLEEVNNG